MRVGQSRVSWAGTVAVVLAASLFSTTGTIVKHLLQGYSLLLHHIDFGELSF